MPRTFRLRHRDIGVPWATQACERSACSGTQPREVGVLRATQAGGVGVRRAAQTRTPGLREPGGLVGRGRASDCSRLRDAGVAATVVLFPIFIALALMLVQAIAGRTTGRCRRAADPRRSGGAFGRSGDARGLPGSAWSRQACGDVSVSIARRGTRSDDLGIGTGAVAGHVDHGFGAGDHVVRAGAVAVKRRLHWHRPLLRRIRAPPQTSGARRRRRHRDDRSAGAGPGAAARSRRAPRRRLTR